MSCVLVVEDDEMLFLRCNNKILEDKIMRTPLRAERAEFTLIQAIDRCQSPFVDDYFRVRISNEDQGVL